MNSVLHGFNLSLLEDIHSCKFLRIEFNFSKTELHFYETCYKQLGVVRIKMKVDNRLPFNNTFSKE